MQYMKRIMFTSFLFDSFRARNWTAHEHVCVGNVCAINSQFEFSVGSCVFKVPVLQCSVFYQLMLISSNFR